MLRKLFQVQARQFLPAIIVFVIALQSNAFVPQKTCSWQLVFNDEFTANNLDRKVWATKYWWGRTNAGNKEEQYYVDDAFAQQGGMLRIRAERKKAQEFDYTSGIITSLPTFSQTYGRYEIRAKVPAGQGLWPSFWLASTKKVWPPEIDVFEVLGHQTNRVYMAHHWKNSAGKAKKAIRSYTNEQLAQGFHTFAVEWLPDSIVWYVDGIERSRTQTGVPSEPMYMLANLAVGGNWPGSPDASTQFPSYFEIDYIRAYQQQCEPK